MFSYFSLYIVILKCYYYCCTQDMCVGKVHPFHDNKTFYYHVILTDEKVHNTCIKDVLLICIIVISFLSHYLILILNTATTYNQQQCISNMLDFANVCLWQNNLCIFSIYFSWCITISLFFFIMLHHITLTASNVCNVIQSYGILEQRINDLVIKIIKVV